MPHIVDASKRFIPGVLVGPEDEDLYEQPRPYSQLFVTCLQAILQTSGEPKARSLYLAFGHKPGTVRDEQYVGFFTGVFDGWELTVNWTPESSQGIPPGHIHVQWRNMEVGTLSPFSDGKPVSGVPSVNRWHNLALVTERDLLEAAAAAIAHATKKDRLFAAFHGDEAQHAKRQSTTGV